LRELKRISYSYLHALACPYQAFLRYEAQIKVKPTDNLVFGSALHHGLETSHKEGWALDRASSLFIEEFRRLIEDEEVFIPYPKMKKMEIEGKEILAIYDERVTQGLPDTFPTEIEKEFEIPFEDEVVIVGKIDKIFHYGEDYFILDYKSGKTEPSEWFIRHDLQFTCYAWAGLELYGKLPTRLYYHSLRKNKLIETTRTLEDIEQLKQMIRNAIFMSKNDLRYRVYHSEVCKWCDYVGNTCDDKELENKLVSEVNEKRQTV